MSHTILLLSDRIRLPVEHILFIISKAVVEEDNRQEILTTTDQALAL